MTTERHKPIEIFNGLSKRKALYGMDSDESGQTVAGQGAAKNVETFLICTYLRVV